MQSPLTAAELRAAASRLRYEALSLTEKLGGLTAKLNRRSFELALKTNAAVFQALRFQLSASNHIRQDYVCPNEPAAFASFIWKLFAFSQQVGVPDVVKSFIPALSSIHSGPSMQGPFLAAKRGDGHVEISIEDLRVQVVKYDFTAEGNGEISVCEGSVVIELSTVFVGKAVHEGWTFVVLRETVMASGLEASVNKGGFVPLSFLEPADEAVALSTRALCRIRPAAEENRRSQLIAPVTEEEEGVEEDAPTACPLAWKVDFGSSPLQFSPAPHLSQGMHSPRSPRRSMPSGASLAVEAAFAKLAGSSSSRPATARSLHPIPQWASARLAASASVAASQAHACDSGFEEGVEGGKEEEDASRLLQGSIAEIIRAESARLSAASSANASSASPRAFSSLKSSSEEVGQVGRCRPGVALEEEEAGFATLTLTAPLTMDTMYTPKDLASPPPLGRLEEPSPSPGSSGFKTAEGSPEAGSSRIAAKHAAHAHDSSAAWSPPPRSPPPRPMASHVEWDSHMPSLLAQAMAAAGRARMGVNYAGGAHAVQVGAQQQLRVQAHLHEAGAKRSGLLKVPIAELLAAAGGEGPAKSHSRGTSSKSAANPLHTLSMSIFRARREQEQQHARVRHASPSRAVPHMTILYSFVSAGPGELTVEAGQTVRRAQDQSSAPEGWVLVEHARDGVGYIPLSYVQDSNHLDEDAAVEPGTGTGEPLPLHAHRLLQSSRQKNADDDAELAAALQLPVPTPAELSQREVFVEEAGDNAGDIPLSPVRDAYARGYADAVRMLRASGQGGHPCTRAGGVAVENVGSGAHVRGRSSTLDATPGPGPLAHGVRAQLRKSYPMAVPAAHVPPPPVHGYTPHVLRAQPPVLRGPALLLGDAFAGAASRYHLMPTHSNAVPVQAQAVSASSGGIEWEGALARSRARSARRAPPQAPQAREGRGGGVAQGVDEAPPVAYLGMGQGEGVTGPDTGPVQPADTEPARGSIPIGGAAEGEVQVPQAQAPVGTGVDRTAPLAGRQGRSAPYSFTFIDLKPGAGGAAHGGLGRSGGPPTISGGRGRAAAALQ